MSTNDALKFRSLDRPPPTSGTFRTLISKDPGPEDPEYNVTNAGNDHETLKSKTLRSYVAPHVCPDREKSIGLT